MNSLLNARKLLAAIGVQFSEDVSANDYKNADIERALIAGSIAIEQGDLRVVNPLFTWIEKNGEFVNVERLKKIMKSHTDPEKIVWVYAMAFFGISHRQSRWKILANVQTQPKFLKNRHEDPLEALEDAKTLQKLKGEPEWSKKTGFILANTSIQTSSKFALDKVALAKISMPFRNRLLFGPNWRADIATAIGNGAKSAKEICALTSCSHEPAHRVLSELTLLKQVSDGQLF